MQSRILQVTVGLGLHHGRLELAGGDPPLEKHVELVIGAVFEFRQTKVAPDDGERADRQP
jgi:hypothetical protein